ncbi:hypothetical protein CKAH01_06987 [Colletotrichum kahawae]|uniref:U3 snoRNA associated n=1 Tax=Colletotrichum kahawae TaxID=34407 RepID=A0AAD9Y590_COLKA|nr:hypothetical protein CKAH01_06987 [Colletotrichum kahawae]
MVTTRNMLRSGVESPGEITTPKKLPVRSKDATPKGTPKSTPRGTPKKGSAKKDESARPSSKKKSSLVVELKADSTPSESADGQEPSIITGPEQPAPEVEDKVINDSDASPEPGNEEEQDVEAPEAEEPAEEAAAADDSDSDEAPEAVSTSKAAVQAKKSAQAANKAIAEQAAAQKRKRQERNTRLQEQAAVRKAQKPAPAEKAKDEDEEMETAAVEAEDLADAEQPGAAAPKKPTRRRLDLPAELPAEFLESDSEDDGEDGADGHPRKARKLNTAKAQISREGRGPKDEVVGSTVFRVVKQEDQRLAPKSHKYSIGTKKAMLARGRTAVGAKKGFLVGSTTQTDKKAKEKRRR